MFYNREILCDSRWALKALSDADYHEADRKQKDFGEPLKTPCQNAVFFTLYERTQHHPPIRFLINTADIT